MTHAPHAITPQEALQRVIEHREIFHDEMLHIMRLIMSGEMSPAVTSATSIKQRSVATPPWKTSSLRSTVSIT